MNDQDERSSSAPLPRFDRPNYVDRGYYLVVEFQDEKRRRDRAAAVELARQHPMYQCLMTAEHRLLHRTVYTRSDLHRFRELYDHISTWSTPRFYVMGYPIEASELLRGIECYERMGSTCNLLTERESSPHPTYFGCPRASVSFKPEHPRAWFRLFYERDPDDAHRYLRVESNLEDEDQVDDPRRLGGCAELRWVARTHCGCPLIHLPRLHDTYERLPEAIELDNRAWSLDAELPAVADRQGYLELLAGLELDRLPCSEVDPFERAQAEQDETRPRRRRRPQVSWLDED